ncbi:MAG: pyrroline-5-carboxylate reductase, partial [Rhizobiaceae bacterium]
MALQLGSIVLVGAGNMGGAMLSGWLKNGVPGA